MEAAYPYGKVYDFVYPQPEFTIIHLRKEKIQEIKFREKQEQSTNTNEIIQLSDVCAEK